MVEISEEALWEIYQFAVFNQKAVNDVLAVLSASSKRSPVLYATDFSELHPYLYPGWAARQADADDFPFHGRAVKLLWESMFRQDLSSLP